MTGHIHSSEELLALWQTRHEVKDLEDMRRVLTILYGEFPISFSSPKADVQGNADIVFTDIQEMVEREAGDPAPYPGALLTGYLPILGQTPETGTLRAHVKAAGWDKWRGLDLREPTGLAEDAKHPGVPAAPPQQPEGER